MFCKNIGKEICSKKFLDQFYKCEGSNHSYKKEHSLETYVMLCLCYCKIFSLVPDSTVRTKIKLLPKSAVHCSSYLNLYNIIAQKKTTNIKKQF